MKLSAKAQAALDKVVARFQSGDLSPISEIARINLPADAPAARWSYSNRVLAYAQTDSLDCRGFRQWEQAGRRVSKGARAGFILGPCTVVKKGKNGDGEDEERPVLVGFRAIPVFAYHQTEGDGDGVSYEPKEPPPLLDVARRLGVEVTWQPVTDDRLGACASDGSRMVIGTHEASVFFHELGHAVHARVNGGSLAGGKVEEKEAVAEFTSCVLMELYGVGDTSGNAWRYIKHFNEKDPLQAVVKALGEVEAILQVLEGGE
jgi:antirestriction protein ArdC